MMLHSTLVLGGFYLPAGIPGVTGNYVAFWASVAILVALAALVVLFSGPQRLKGHTEREGVYAWRKS